MSAIETPEPKSRRSAGSAAAVILRPFLERSIETKILLVVLAVLSLWGLAILSFGVPALVWPMKLIVPAMVFTLVFITWNW